MTNIDSFTHVDICFSNKSQSVKFYELLRFTLLEDTGLEQGHPIIIMKHPNGEIVNLLDPANITDGDRVFQLMKKPNTQTSHRSKKLFHLILFF